MNVKSFEVHNFKSIAHSTEISFPKIAIFIGPNSSGKSSIFQSLLLMKQTFEAEEPSMPLVLNGPYISLGGYEDFIHNKNANTNFCVNFNFEPEDKKPYVCDVCGSEYKYASWFLKHVENYHSAYWAMYKDKISKDDYHLPKQQSLNFRYSFDSTTRTIRIDQLEFKNPPAVNGLILSSLKINQLKNKIQIELFSNQNQRIYSKVIKTLDEKDPINHSLMVDCLFNYLNYYYLYYVSSETISVVDKDYGDVLKLNDEKEILQSKISIDANEIMLTEKSRREFRPSSEDEKVAAGIESRLTYVALNLRYRLKDIFMFLKQIHYVGPLRNWPERIYFGTGGKPSYVGEKGEYAHEMFWLDKRTGHEDLLKMINEWLVKLKFDVKLKIDDSLGGDLYQLKIEQNGLLVNLTDVGFGLSQILPILTECLNYSSKKDSVDDIYSSSYFANQYFFLNRYKEYVNKLVICQQPEIHLNPRIQAELGDFFVQLESSNLSLLIETHSEHLVTRLQRRVAEGKLDPDDIIIYFVSQNNSESVIEPIKISSDGVFTYWPEDFFQDDYKDSIEILKASLRRSADE